MTQKETESKSRALRQNVENLIKAYLASTFKLDSDWQNETATDLSFELITDLDIQVRNRIQDEKE